MISQIQADQSEEIWKERGDYKGYKQRRQMLNRQGQMVGTERKRV